ncbi:hypothetical protein BJY01DRAFT_132182 [Aspergillus pseudoustus]|uniref:C2H2-type domain-containing protein n=1 Tax=Aspergillus pseudoustus TaxID=1810923 RepID=A0ABR4IM84_9EURO
MTDHVLPHLSPRLNGTNPLALPQQTTLTIPYQNPYPCQIRTQASPRMLPRRILSSVMSAVALSRSVTYSSKSKHKKRHDKPHKCAAAGCTKAFESRKDLRRHCNTLHPDVLENPEWYFCHIQGCKQSIEAGGGFSRKDNRDRHLDSHARKGEL